MNKPCYFLIKHSDSNKEFSETDRINMLEYWTTHLFCFGGRVFQKASDRYDEQAVPGREQDIFMFSQYKIGAIIQLH
jgi:hypothetical protein